MENAYENVRRVVYGEGAQFIPVCEKCGRFVKAPDRILVSEWDGNIKEPEVDCSKCGKSKMIFEGWY
jgi:ribosomal protein S27E